MNPATTATIDFMFILINDHLVLTYLISVKFILIMITTTPVTFIMMIIFAILILKATIKTNIFHYCKVPEIKIVYYHYFQTFVKFQFHSICIQGLAYLD